MLLRASILIVLVLNLGVAAWWWAGGEAPGAQPEAVVEAGPRLRLVSETMPAPPPADAVLPGATAAAGPAARCVRVGPFEDAAARDAVRARLEALADRVLPREIPAPGGRGWRVILPPLASREQATATAERLRAAGVNDLYVLNQGPEANAIALGRYRNEDAARRREADLRGRGFAVRTEPLDGGQAQWWLDARLRPGSDPVAFAAPGDVRELDCARLLASARVAPG